VSSPEYQNVVILPDEIVMGSRLYQEVELPDYPAATWTLSVAIVTTTARIAITGAPLAGNAYVLDVAATVTAAAPYVAGTFEWQAYVTAGADRRTVGRGSVKILADFATQTAGLDTRSDIKKMLDAISLVLVGKASKDVQEYQINGRSLTSYTFTELREMLEYLKAEYKAEQEALGILTGKQSKRIVRYQFGVPS
jgi:hypothetical protein